MASKGTISKSSNSRMETMRCPRGAWMSPRSANTCITMAVDVSTKPAPLMKDTCQEKPNARPTPVSSSAHSTTCMLPSPKICPRKLHRCEGFISSPMTKRNITTPSSATWMMVWASSTRPSP
ncbi:hypothetical protein D3C78_1605610 [compost metagenome]